MAQRSPRPGKPRARSPRASRRAPSSRIVAVTGAFGFLGRRIIRRLEQDDAVDRIVAIDVRSPLVLAEREGEPTAPAAYLSAHPRLSAHQIDLTEATASRELVDIFTNEGVGAVFHLAFLSNPTHALEMAHELETIGTMYVLQAIARSPVTALISASSTMCYGARPDNAAWLTEEHPLRPPASRFVRDKADADQQVRAFAAAHPVVATAVLRLAPLFGAGVENFWTRHFTRPVVPVALGYDPLLQLLHPDDAADALLLALKRRAVGAFNVVGRGVLPVSRVARQLGRAVLPLPTGVGRSLVAALWGAQLLDIPPAFVDYLRWPFLADGARFRKAVGFAPAHDLASTLHGLGGPATGPAQPHAAPQDSP